MSEPDNRPSWPQQDANIWQEVHSISVYPDYMENEAGRMEWNGTINEKERHYIEVEYKVSVNTLRPDLTPENSKLLFSQAEDKLNESVSLHEFTKDLHDNLDQDQKEEVITLLWKLAISDDNLDKYEDYLVRKIADLLYVSNSIVLKIKHQVFIK